MIWLLLTACGRSAIEQVSEEIEDISVLETQTEYENLLPEEDVRTVVETLYTGSVVSTLSSYMQFYVDGNHIYRQEEPSEPERLMEGEHVVAFAFGFLICKT